MRYFKFYVIIINNIIIFYLSLSKNIDNIKIVQLLKIFKNMII